MKFKFLNFSFFILLLTNMMTLYSNSWFFMWMIMEINLISFIKMLSSNKNFNNELLMNYFLIQSFNSYLFMMSSIILQMNFLSLFMKLIILMSLMCKMGMPPFFMWYFKMMININCWIMFFMNSCMQKFIPFMIINNFLIFNEYVNSMIMIMIIFSTMFIPFLGINSFNLWVMMSVSSIIQTLWILFFIMVNEYWMIYFITYCLISLSIMLIFKNFNINHLLDMYMLKFNNKINFYLINMNILSLAGMPPFIGFLNKFIFMWNLMKLNMFMLMSMIIMSLMNLYFYLRIMFSLILNNFYSKNFMYKFLNFNISKMNFLINLWYMSILGLMLLEIF